MKNMFKLAGVIAIAAVIGFSMAACGDGNDDDPPEPPVITEPPIITEPTVGPLDGTWVSEGNGTKLVIGDGGITVSNYDDHLENPYYGILKGTITTSGSNLTVTFTQVNSAMLGQEGVSLGLAKNTWYTKEELKTAITAGLASNNMTQTEAEQMYKTKYEANVNGQFETQTGTYAISGSTLTLVLEGETNVFVKNGTYTAPPWRWSAYSDSNSDEGGNSSINMSESSGTLTFTGTVADKDNGDSGYVGINVYPNKATLAALKTAASIKFDVYGDGNKYVIRVATSDITDWAYYQKEFTPTANTWTSITINISELEQPDWQDIEEKDFTQSLVEEIQIQPHWEVTDFSFSIRNLTLQQ